MMNDPESGFALQQPCARAAQDANADAIVITAPMIQHDYGPAARLQHAMNFCDRARSVGRVMQNAVRINSIECVIGKVQVLGVGHTKFTRQAGNLKSSPSQINGRFGQVNAGIVRAGFGKLGSIRSQPASDFEDTQSVRAAKIRRVGNVPLFRVAMRFDPCEKLRRAHLVVSEPGTARMRLPEGAYALFQIVVCAGWIRIRACHECQLDFSLAPRFSEVIRNLCLSLAVSAAFRKPLKRFPPGGAVYRWHLAEARG